MTYKGTVRGGVIILEPGADLPEGQAVEVRPALSNSTPSLHERLKGIIGAVKNLPPDASRNVDHYLYQAPRR
jgi:hypothetical protein